jgi:ectoine hydroxylase-related dioxygenase (phytanoyl-CoA dioxygenase family)
MSRLSQDAADFYQKNGYYLFHEPVFSKEKFCALSDIFEDLLIKNPDKRPDTLDTPHFDEPRLLDFLLADEVLDLVEPLIGPDIGLWSSHFICKEPKTGRATPWHEDSRYWNGRFEDFTGIVTIWLAIDKVDRGNGCMKVIPGSHTGEVRDYRPVDKETNTFGTEIVGVDENLAVYFELAPNECSFHDSRMMHAADANTSSRRRCGYTMRYFSQQMKYNLDHPRAATFHLWHCRGKNPHNNPVVN